LYPSLNAWLIARHGWREAFTMIALAPLLLLPLVLFVIKDSPARAGLQPLGALPWPEGAGGCGAPAAAGDLAAALRTRDFWLIATAGFCTFFALLGFSNNLFLHMHDLGYDDAAAARAYFPLFAMGLVGKLGAGALSEWLPRKTVFLLFLGLMLGGSVLFATLDATLLWPALWIFGLGWGGNYTLLQALVADVFGVGSLGRILGSLTVIDALGGALGPFVLALLFRGSDSYQGGFVLMSGLIALALAAAMAVRVPRPEVT
jgi:MFS family permease